MLPDDILHELGPYLDAASLCRVCRTCSFLDRTFVPFLYRDLYVELRLTGLSERSKRLIRTLQASEQKRALVRRVAVVSLEPSEVALQTHMDLLLATFAGLFAQRSSLRAFLWQVPIHMKLVLRILRFLPPTLEKLEIESALIDREVEYPSLTDMTCRKLSDPLDSAWVRRHLELGRIQRLALSVANDWSKRTVSEMLNAAGDNPSLTHLALQGFDLSTWSLFHARSLVELKLSRCENADVALDSLCSQPPRIGLRVLCVTIGCGESQVTAAVKRLARVAPLEELTILESGVCVPFPISDLLDLPLRKLVLESRGQSFNSDSVLPYSTECLATVIQAFPLLKTLGLPIELDEASRKRWVRIESGRQG